MNVSLVIPSRNNLKYVKAAYESIRRHLGNDVEVILLDDASTDDTWKWMCDTCMIPGHNTIAHRNKGPERVGHTVLYDEGARMANNEIFGIFHADMLATPHYIENMVKHLKRGTVVSATRVEPPLHPPGPEKHVINFGMEPEEFREKEFIEWVSGAEAALLNQNAVSNGIFAPWMMYKEDFFAINGHDKRVFAPMELEDSDLFNRFLLKGYKLIQSRDAFVYHMTCRGSRFKDGVKIVQQIPVGGGHIWNRAQDSDEYTQLRNIKFREWWRKWHMDVLHDSNMLPIVYPRYKVGLYIENANMQFLEFFEPWVDFIYINDPNLIEAYIAKEQPRTKFNLQERVIIHSTLRGFEDIKITFDAHKFDPNKHIPLWKQFPLIIQESGEEGTMELDIFTVDIDSLKTYNQYLINANDPWYVAQLCNEHH
jgi:glycosyltransferase involved in cell wall biosynthesis